MVRVSNIEQIIKSEGGNWGGPLISKGGHVHSSAPRGAATGDNGTPIADSVGKITFKVLVIQFVFEYYA